MTGSPLRSSTTGVLIDLWVVPGSSRTEIVGVHGGRVKVRVNSPPEGGRANRDVAKLLRHVFGAKASLVTGMSSRNKVFEIAEVDVDTVTRKLGLDV